MKAAVLYIPGSAEQFQIIERPIPVPKEGEVLVKIRAFGLNRSELMTRKGLSPSVTFPRVLGIECVGEVEYDPSGSLQKGQAVAALMGGMGREYDGSYAEFAVLPKELLIPFSSSLSWLHSGALPEMFYTAYGSLFQALLVKEGEGLLVRGGTSSVGLLAIQLAKANGLKVVATTRNPDNESLLLENGASHVLIDDGSLKDKIKQFYPDGIDKALELVGAATLPDTLHCVKPGGVVCMTGMLSEVWSIPDFAPMEFIPATVYLTIYDSGQIRTDAAVFQQFIQQVEAGIIKIDANKVFTLDEIVQAHQLMESNKAGGKIVVVNHFDDED